MEVSNKKILFSLIGFISSILILQLGVVKFVIIFLATWIPYKIESDREIRRS